MTCELRKCIITFKLKLTNILKRKGMVKVTKRQVYFFHSYKIKVGGTLIKTITNKHFAEIAIISKNSI